MRGLIVLVPIVIWFAVIGGYIANIVKLCFTLGDPTVTPMFVGRIAGVVLPPLGAVLGFF